jgi:uncharacterized membrane protein
MRLITLYMKVLLALLKVTLGAAIVICLVLMTVFPNMQDLVQHLTEALVALIALNFGHSEYGFYKRQIKIWTEGE